MTTQEKYVIFYLLVTSDNKIHLIFFYFSNIKVSNYLALHINIFNLKKIIYNVYAIWMAFPKSFFFQEKMF